MTVTEARRQIWLLRIIGFAFTAIGGVICITSIVKHVEAVSAQDYLLMQLFGKLIDAIVDLAYGVLWPFWEIAPDISLPPPFSINHLVTSGNISFVFLYIIHLAGIACLNRASAIGKRVEAREEIRKEALRHSMGGAYSAPDGIEVFIHLPGGEGWLSKVHAYYIAPFVIAFVVYQVGMN